MCQIMTNLSYEKEKLTDEEIKEKERLDKEAEIEYNVLKSGALAVTGLGNINAAITTGASVYIAFFSFIKNFMTFWVVKLCFSLNLLYEAGSRQDNRNVAAAVSKTAGGMTGWAAGAAAGASIGSIVPVFGTAIGGFVGGYFGGSYGASNAEALSNMVCDASNADWRCPKCKDWTIEEKEFDPEESYEELGRTEIAWDTLNPVFKHKIVVNYNAFVKV